MIYQYKGSELAGHDVSICENDDLHAFDHVAENTAEPKVAATQWY